MSTRRSDALQALVAEWIDADTTVDDHRAAEDVARTEYVAARQALDLAAGRTKDAIARRDTTGQALALIATRDEISEDTLDALKARARF